MTVDTKAEDTKQTDEKKADPPKPAEKKQGTFDADYVEKLRKENADYRTKAKDNAEKAEKFDAQVEAGKSDLQKAQDRAAKAEKDVEAERIARVRSEVGRDKNIPATMVGRLKGTTVEEMNADADAILADISAGYVSKTGKSQESTGAGKTGTPVDYEAMDPGELVKMVREKHR